MSRKSTSWYNKNMRIVFEVALVVIGSCVGSFLCCQARRMHYKVTAKKNRKKMSKRSECMECGYRLKWYDNIPIISWIALKGKCRKCGEKIGKAEILAEVCGAAAYAAIGTTIDIATAGAMEWAVLLATFLLVAVLGFLAIYDGLYGELPSICLTISMICAIIVLILKEWRVISVGGMSAENIIAPLMSVMILGGVYLILYMVSRGKWVGDGDWLLGTSIGIALASPWLSLVTLFLTNALACAVMLPIVRKNKQTKVHLGPFMVAAYVITAVFANSFAVLMIPGMI